MDRQWVARNDLNGARQSPTIADFENGKAGRSYPSGTPPHNVKLDYGDVLMVPGTSTPVASRKDVQLASDIHFAQHPNVIFHGIPIMAANMDGVGSLEMADALMKFEIFTCLAKILSEKEITKFLNEKPERSEYCAVTVGLRDSNIESFRHVHRSAANLKYACLDVANGHTRRFIDFVKYFRNEFPDIVIIAGNVVTPEQTVELVEAGADLVKVGIGGGSVCETRIKTGVGYPQFSAVVECGIAARENGANIVGDGGCTCPGDVAKSLAAGSAFAMLGGMLAGHQEGGGRIITRRFSTNEMDERGKPIIRERKYVEFYGMSSQVANEKHFNGLKPWKTSEGREVLLPYRESLDDTLRDLLGGLRSACTYLGAESMSELPDRARFVRCHDTHNRIFEDNAISEHPVSAVIT